MKPARFTYHRPESLDAALDLLAEHGEDATLLAGGQSLVPLMNMRLSRPEYLVDLNRCDDLDYIVVTDDQIAVGARARQRTVELNRDVAGACSLIPQMLSHVGHAAIRNRGTICGSLAHADPAAELPTAAVTLDARVILSRRGERRELPATDFYLGTFMTAREPDELLTEVRFPIQPAMRYSFLEAARRHGDFAIAGVAIAVQVEDGHAVDVRVGLVGVASTPLRATQAERALVGQTPSPELLRHVGRLAAEEYEPISDIHGSSDYRRQLVSVLTERALAQVLEDR